MMAAWGNCNVGAVKALLQYGPEPGPDDSIHASVAWKVAKESQIARELERMSTAAE